MGQSHQGKTAVIEEVAQEMRRRDPNATKTRLALTDGERARPELASWIVVYRSVEENSLAARRCTERGAATASRRRFRVSADLLTDTAGPELPETSRRPAGPVQGAIFEFGYLASVVR